MAEGGGANSSPVALAGQWTARRQQEDDRSQNLDPMRVMEECCPPNPASDMPVPKAMVTADDVVLLEGNTLDPSAVDGIHPEGNHTSLTIVSNITRVSRDPDECVDGTPTAPQDAVTKASLNEWSDARQEVLIAPPPNCHPAPTAPRESKVIVDQPNAFLQQARSHHQAHSRVSMQISTRGRGI